METRTAQETWEAALGELQVQVSRSNFRTWFAKTTGLSYQEGSFIIGVPNTFIAEYLEKNQRSLIEKVLISLTSRDIQVAFRVNGKHHAAENDGENTSTDSPENGRLNPGYLFESFVEGENNRLAKAAATAVAQNPGHTYNPLFIHGGVGMGKTHLLHAVGHLARSNKVPVACLSAEKFTNEYVSALREKKMAEFHQRYRSTAMLLIDDIQFLSGKEQTEETFFHTFNELHNDNHQIVITSDRAPQDMPQLTERLRSRFAWGLIVDIRPPDGATRLAILQDKARRKEVSLNPDVLEFIAAREQPNVRELEGSLNRVIAFSRLVQSKPDIALAAKALEDLAQKQPGPAPSSAHHIISAVAESFQLTPAGLTGQQRDKETVLARRVAMYLLRQETGYPLARIGQELGGRDAAAVTNACKKVGEEISSSHFLRKKVAEIQQKIHNLAR